MSAVDLSLAWPSDPTEARRALSTLQRLGYAAVCWSHEVAERLGPAHACPITPLPEPGDGGAADSSFTRRVRQHTRLTLHVEETAHLAAIRASNDALRSYEVVAVVPHTEAMLEALLEPPVVDLIDVISLPSSSDRLFGAVLRHGLVRRAIERGLALELCYSEALRDGLSRRRFVSAVQRVLPLLPRHARAEAGLVLSSGADDARLLRSPADVANLVTLFGCHPTAARQAVSDAGQRVLRRAAARRRPPPLAPAPPAGLFELEGEAPDAEGEAKGKRKRAK